MCVILEYVYIYICHPHSHIIIQPTYQTLLLNITKIVLRPLFFDIIKWPYSSLQLDLISFPSLPFHFIS